ncbi:nSTAND1 domain-containing NTPase [Streptomyces sp. SP18CS02]|uniref:nSTAND1 domain-containing NTPase n=1 Tax=Streptomyces sp. SP18CS02 TaxID=3002531 RepID=UPI002E784851|nr:hypothetical protein [Streptomyces sp. SP18CS02]MEE1755234.1 hypothetical protein [Streptomyces sp. SP18CS02]
MSVSSAAAALVGAMTTDAWQQARAALVAWWRRMRPQQADRVDDALAESRERALTARRAGDENAEAHLVAAWEARLTALLWEDPGLAVELRRAGHVLTVDGYESTGGIAHSVTAEADRCFDRLDPRARRTAEDVFLRLVKFGDGTDDTRRPVRYRELVSHGAHSAEAAEVIETFTRGRLLTCDKDTVTITHEVLLRAWRRLRQWIEAHRAQYVVRQRLEDAAAAWSDAGRDPGLLYRGSRLDEARALADDKERAGSIRSCPPSWPPRYDSGAGRAGSARASSPV